MKIGEVETDELSLEQLKELALGTAVPPADLDPQDPPRDDQGRFVAASDPQDSDPQGDPEPQEFVRTIDLGDGSGVQVFRGATAEEVADKLVEAQRNASKKIRADNQEMKNLRDRLEAFEAQKSAKPLTEDEKFLLAQQIQTDPIAAQAEILRRMGLDPKTLKQAVEAVKQQELINNNVAVFQQWIQGTPDFVDTESNGKKIGNYLTRFHGGIATTAAITEAYNNLKADGLLQEKAPVAAPTQTPIRRSSGLSSRRTVTPPPPVAEDPRTMPLEELKRKANGGKDYGGW